MSFMKSLKVQVIWNFIWIVKWQNAVFSLLLIFVSSGTRREEALLGKDELEKVWALRKGMNDSHEYTEAFIKKLADTKTNQEFLDSLASPSAGSTGVNKGKVKNSAS